MNLQDIAVRGEWRELVTPGLQNALEWLEAQGVEFFWTHGGSLPPGTYLFNAKKDDVLLTSHDGSEMPRKAISEAILGVMTAHGAFPQQESASSRRTRNRARALSSPLR
ncbi:hypothetical protein [Deinococcus apachensis]|uniref:hypothetical protein n=1 Tax=Deinococcus apachensis TaxID=309886 RepID=UPI00036D1958|nr:hypothetical protein [Deinococcus apachensis]